MAKVLLKYAVLAVFVLLFLIVSGKLFREKEFDWAVAKLRAVFALEGEAADRLRVAISSDIAFWEPTIYESGSRGFMMNIFESLARPNKFLEIKPQLAVSWGVLEDGRTWEFLLRREVLFHDGSPFTADDVISSVERARSFSGSQLKTILANIATVEKINDYAVRIKTKDPDAVFPQKIATVLIFPSEKKDFAGPSSLVGTAPYRLANKNGKIITLLANEHYWGQTPKFREVKLEVLADKKERLEALRQKRVEIVLDVPPDAVGAVEELGYELKIRPGLDSNFLFFNLKHPDLQNPSLRKALALALNREFFQDFGAAYLTPLHQFAPAGILGYDPQIPLLEYDLKTAKDLARLAAPTKGEIKIVLAKRLEVLGKFLQRSFQDLGLKVKLVSVPEAEVLATIASGEGDAFFLGWRFGFGDIADFLGEVVHSRSEDGTWGKLNHMNYQNPHVDALIESGFSTLDQKERSAQFKEIMKIIVNEDIIGLPLFSSRIISAHAPHIKWQPRLDAYFIAAEVK